MRKLCASIALAVGCLAGTPALADPVVLEASSPWNIDYGTYKCTLKRAFGTGRDTTFLQLEQLGMGNFYNLMISGDPVRKTRGIKMEVRFGPHEAATERGFLAKRSKEQGQSFVIMHGVHLAPLSTPSEDYDFVAPAIGPEREKAISEIALDRGLANRLVLQTGPLDAPLEAMRECSRNLVDTLGLSDEDQETVAQKPKPTNLMEVAKKLQAIYPAEMIRNEQEGLVMIRTLVNEKGSPEGCQIAQSTRPAVFDDLVCFMVIREMTFEAARNADGEPVPAFYQQAVRYVLP